MNIGLYIVGDRLGTGTAADSFLTASMPVQVVKRLKNDLAESELTKQRFLDALTQTSRIKSRRFLAMVLSQKTCDDGVYLVREHVEGRSLAQLQQEGQLASLNAKQLAYDLCDALRALHLQGIVHGGVHPGNIIVQADGHLKLVDFGIGLARLTGKVDKNYPMPAARYLAPEQWAGQEIGPAADLYSAGLVVALLAEQREPITGKSHTEIKQQVTAGVKIDCPILAQAVAREPSRRYADAEKMRAALKERFTGLGRPAQSPESIEPEPGPAPPPVAPSGTLRSMRDLKGGVDLLALNHGQPWRLPRTGGPQQWPVFFANAGPGDLNLELRCLGRGIALTPHSRRRIKPGRSRYAIVALDAHGSDFARLDVGWDGQRHSERVQIRIYRPNPAA